MRLLEGAGLEEGKVKQTAWTREPIRIRQDAEYMRHLAALRAELLQQEQASLTSVLSRLGGNGRQTSRSNAHAQFRLRLRDQESPPRRPLMTTLERFQQQRRPRSPPLLFPLEGKQLLETPTESRLHGEVISPHSSPRVEDTVRANLQRLQGPVSSIPNIGRKALHHAQLELRSQPVGRGRGRPRGGKLAQGLQLSSSYSDGQASGGSIPHSHSPSHVRLSPETFRLGPLSEGDRIDMDKLQQYYYLYCQAPATPGSGEGRQSSGDSSLHTSARSRPTRPQWSRHSRKPLSRETTGGSSGEGLGDSSGSNGSLRHTTVLPAIPSVAEHHHPHHPSLSSRSPTLRSHPFDPHLSTRSLPPRPPTLGGGEAGRVQIVVDMPAIIFNAATPDVSEEKAELAVGALSKAVKQNEIRQRELNNLMEDVRELNRRSDKLASNGQADS